MALQYNTIHYIAYRTYIRTYVHTYIHTYIALHCIALHYITLHDIRYTTLRYTNIHSTSHHITITLHYTTYMAYIERDTCAMYVTSSDSQNVLLPQWCPCVLFGVSPLCASQICSKLLCHARILVGRAFLRIRLGALLDQSARVHAKPKLQAEV